MHQTERDTRLRHPINDFIVDVLPDWLRTAGRASIERLRARVSAHLDSEKQLAPLLRQLHPLDAFARERLGAVIETRMGTKVELASALWREERLRINRRPFDPLPLLPDFETYFTYEPLLQKLLLNFKAGESFGKQTVVLRTQPVADRPADIVTSDIDSLVSLCREVDVGAAYQEHLAQVLTADFERALARSLRQAFAVAVELAALKGQLAGSHAGLLRQLGQDMPVGHAQGLGLTTGRFQLLGCRVDGALSFELFEPPRKQSDVFGMPDRLRAVVLYLPHDPQRPLQVFSDWQAVNHSLVVAMGDERYSQAFGQRIALDDRARYLTLLNIRLADSQPDLQPAKVALAGNTFVALAADHVRRIKADSRFIAVPTAEVDRAVAEQRLNDLAGAGLALVSLAGLFVPAIGAVLMADMARRLLGHVYEGVRDWGQGHEHEALQHMLEVAASVAVLGAVTLGVHTARNAFVESLEPITTERGAQRLWRNDLSVYRQAPADMELTERHDGLFSGDGALWWYRDGLFHAVRQDGRGLWRLLHRDDPEAFGPILRGNGERAWLLSTERPLEWQGAVALLVRLWPSARGLEAHQVAQILRVADIDEAFLRGLLVESRPLPVSLRDTLERFAVNARNELFFEQQGSGPEYAKRLQWSTQILGLDEQPLAARIDTINANVVRLRGPMLDHFAELYLPDDACLWLVRRDFPSLPKAYALEVLKQATSAMRASMAAQHRLPLVLAQRARSMLQEVRLVRLREALFLSGSYSPDMVGMVFGLLRQRGLVAGQVDLILHQRSSSGPVLQRLLPAYGDTATRIDMVWRDGHFQLFDSNGRASELQVAEPQGLFDVLAASLAPGYMAKLGWTAEHPAQAIREQMQAWLPDERKALLAMLGWREATAQASSFKRLSDGRMGYPLGPLLSLIEAPEATLRRRIRALYPSLDEADVEMFLGNLLERSQSPFSNLLAQEQDYVRLDHRLNEWARLGNAFEQASRNRAADVFRRVWRMEGERAPSVEVTGWGMHLALYSEPLGDLPLLPEPTDFAHVTNLSLVNVHINRLPAGFLRNFPRLERLDLSFNSLQALPHGLEHLPNLRQLYLNGNRMRLTRADADVLSGLTLLRVLDLSGNSARTAQLSVGRMANLQRLLLNRMRLDAVPDGLERLTLLVHADLRNNQIAELPQALLDAPSSLRTAIDINYNPLSQAVHQRFFAPSPPPPEVVENVPLLTAARTQWLGTLDDQARASAEADWDTLRGVRGSDAFFDVLGELTQSADFRHDSAGIGQRVWNVMAAARNNDRLRQNLFDLAAEPRTCADSVAHIFSQIEVVMHLSQFTRDALPLASREARLRLAQRLFRLDKVARLARADINARYADGRWTRGAADEEEIEVSLAYRSGLAERLDLLGQPTRILFSGLADVSRQDLDRAAAEVLHAEGTDECTVFISQCDFWRAYLRANDEAAFTTLEDAYSDRWDRFESGSTTLSSQAYKDGAAALRDAREAAIDALALSLTRAELQQPG